MAHFYPFTYTMSQILFIVLSLLMVIFLLFIIGCKKVEKQPEASKQAVVQSTQNNGENLFNEHCIMCHPDDKRMKDIKKLKDITKTMRNPKSGMPKFNEEEIPNDAAEAIAKYIFSSVLFKK